MARARVVVVDFRSVIVRQSWVTIGRAGRVVGVVLWARLVVVDGRSRSVIVCQSPLPRAGVPVQVVVGRVRDPGQLVPTKHLHLRQVLSENVCKPEEEILSTSRQLLVVVNYIQALFNMGIA